MVIDKEGKMIDSNAPNPGNPEGREKLTSLIKQSLQK